MNLIRFSSTLAVVLTVAVLSPAKTVAGFLDAPPPSGGEVSRLVFANEIMASLPGQKSRMFVLLGSGFIRAPQADGTGAFIQRWRKAHPAARYIPVSRMLTTNTLSHEQFDIVYIWLIDGTANLNVELVKGGFVQGGTMFDAVDNRRALDRMLASNPGLAEVRDSIARERAAAPQDHDERLVSEAAYNAFLDEVRAAEVSARSHKLGLWSDPEKWKL